jgi:hypothetical protein
VSGARAQAAANIDDGDMFPVAFAVTAWSPAVEERVTALIKAAVS